MGPILSFIPHLPSGMFFFLSSNLPSQPSSRPTQNSPPSLVCSSILCTYSFPSPPASHWSRSRSKSFTGAASPPSPPVVTVRGPGGPPLRPRLRPSHCPARASGVFRGRCWVSPASGRKEEALQRPVTVAAPFWGRRQLDAACEEVGDGMGEAQAGGWGQA